VIHCSFHNKISVRIVKKNTGVSELRKSAITFLLLKISTFTFFLDDSYASTAHSENIAVYIQSVSLL
jgi:hypothetical protein